jgi:hypothetical protein
VVFLGHFSEGEKMSEQNLYVILYLIVGMYSTHGATCSVGDRLSLIIFWPFYLLRYLLGFYE